MTIPQHSINSVFESISESIYVEYHFFSPSVIFARNFGQHRLHPHLVLIYSYIRGDISTGCEYSTSGRIARNLPAFYSIFTETTEILTASNNNDIVL